MSQVTTTTRFDARERVARGAALLDVVHPDWYRGVDVERLAIADGRNCVLGQLYGSYTVGVVRVCNAFVQLTDAATRVRYRAHAYGFQGTVAEFVLGRGNDEYAALTAAWRDLVVSRQLVDLVAATG